MPDNNNVNNSQRFLLSKLKNSVNIKVPQTGFIEFRNINEFGNVAENLDVPLTRQIPKNFSSIPNIWSRPLAMELAFHTLKPDHPLRGEFIAQWQGMLAAIALAEINNYPLKTSLLEIGKLNLPNPNNPNQQTHHFAKALYSLRPADNYKLYSLKPDPQRFPPEEQNNPNPWLDVYIFYWNNQPVGMTSPSTLVCPSEEGIWGTFQNNRWQTKLPWWNEAEKRLVSPIPYLINTPDQKSLLYVWLEKLKSQLNNFGGNPTAIGNILELLKSFQDQLGLPYFSDIEQQQIWQKYLDKLQQNEQQEPNLLSPYFSQKSLLNGANLRGALITLDNPLKTPSIPSSVQLKPLNPIDNQKSKPPLLIIAPDIPTQWGINAANICIYEGMRLNTFDENKLNQAKQLNEIDYIKADDLLLSEFYFTEESLTDNKYKLFYENKPITPIIPINPKLLEYFTTEDLLNPNNNPNQVKLEFGDINNNRITITLTLPLSGTNNQIQIYSYRKEYQIKSENRLTPIPVLQTKSSDANLPSPQKWELAIDIPQGENYYQQHYIWGNTNYHLINLGYIKNQINNQNYQYLFPNDIFLDEFYFIDTPPKTKNNDREEYLFPNSLEAKGMYSIKQKYNNNKFDLITPLIPIKSSIIKYFTPEELINLDNDIDKPKLEFLQTEEDQQNKKIKVILRLPLNGNNNSSTYEYSKIYILNDNNALTSVPIIEIWPNFKADNWKYYYSFYYDRNEKNDTFQVDFESIDNHQISDGGNYELTKLDKFPSFLQCKNKNQNIGIIFIKTPEQVQPNNPKSWTVGIDFGSSFTNVAYSETNFAGNGNNQGQIAQKFPLSPLFFSVTKVEGRDRIIGIYEYFMLQEEGGDSLPLSTVLTTRGGVGNLDKVIFDGRIYTPKNPDVNEFKTQEQWLEADLKWTTDNRLNLLFLKQLGLQIIAQAVKNNVRKIQWSIAYPGAFSETQKRTYISQWNNRIKTELEQFTTIDNDGIPTLQHLFPANLNDQFYKTESLAIARYFQKQDKEGLNLIKTTCIDLGGGTSDISIWETNDNIVHQCSIKLAGRHLFSQFLQLNPKFLERQFNEFIEIDDNGKPKGGETKFNAKLDFLLRQKGKEWLENAVPQISENEEFKGLIQLTTIGMAGLYYYTGILLKVLRHNEKYEDNPQKRYFQDEADDHKVTVTDVYIGGNGSQFLHWIDPTGKFDQDSIINKLLRKMLSKGSGGFKESGRNTYISQSPKNEVAYGLVIPQIVQPAIDDVPSYIAGENYQVNNQLYDYDTFIKLPKPSDNENEHNPEFEFIIPTLKQLPQFMKDFHVTLDELNITSIPALPTLPSYKVSEKLEDNEILWRNTKEKLLQELIEMKAKARGDINKFALEPPFILGLKALLSVLGEQWANKWNK